MTDDLIEKQRQQSLDMVKKIIRGTGAFLMLGGVAIAFNILGVAGLFGFEGDVFLCKAVGGMLFVVGLIDFFFMPRILEHKAKVDM